MAKLAIIQAEPAPPPPVTGYTLELDPEEYEALRAVLAGIAKRVDWSTGRTFDAGEVVYTLTPEVSRYTFQNAMTRMWRAVCK